MSTSTGRSPRNGTNPSPYPDLFGREVRAAEEQVVGTLLRWPDTIADTVGVVEARHFGNDDLRSVFESCLRVSPDIMRSHLDPEASASARASLGRDPMTVWDDVVSRGLSATVSREMIQRLYDTWMNALGVKVAGPRVVRCHRMRALMDAARTIYREVGRTGSIDDDGIARIAQATIAGLNDAAMGGQIRTAEESLDGFSFHLGPTFRVDSPITGIICLDDAVLPFEPSSLTVVAGRPGMGKTTFMRHLLKENAGRHRSAVFTMEESIHVFRDKMLCLLARVSYRKLIRRCLDETERSRVVMAMETYKDMLLDVGDATMTAEAVSLNCRKLAALGRKPRVVFIDHLHHMRHDRQKGENDASTHGRSVKVLADLAKELECSVVLLAQLNRDCERDPDPDGPRPHLWHLRASGSIEELAAVVIFLWAKEREDGTRYVHVAKNRHGQTFESTVFFDGEYGLLGDLARAPLRGREAADETV